MRRRIWHPRRHRLGLWLDEGDPRLDHHVESCLRCANVLEEMSGSVPALGDALRSMLAPPEGLQVSLRTGVESRIETRRDAFLLADLLGLPWHTVKALTLGDTEPGGGDSS